MPTFSTGVPEIVPVRLVLVVACGQRPASTDSIERLSKCYLTRHVDHSSLTPALIYSLNTPLVNYPVVNSLISPPIKHAATVSPLTHLSSLNSPCSPVSRNRDVFVRLSCFEVYWPLPRRRSSTSRLMAGTLAVSSFGCSTTSLP